MCLLLTCFMLFTDAESFTVNEPLYLPSCVKVNQSNQVMVLDQSESLIVVFHQNGKLAFRLGAAGQGPGEFNNPTDFDMFSDGRIIVADSGNRRLQIFDREGQYLDMIRISDHAIGRILVLENDHFVLTESNGWSFSITLGEEKREKKRFHQYNAEGIYVKSFGKFRDHENPLLAIRLNQGPMVRSGNKILFASGCASELIWYDGSNEKKFSYPLMFIPEEPVEKVVSREEGGERVFSMAVKADFVCLGMDLLDNGDILILRAMGPTIMGEGLPKTRLVRLSPEGKVLHQYPGEFESRGIAVSNDNRYVYIICEDDDKVLQRLAL